MHKQAITSVMLAGAHAYARADRSDPFALNRAMSHTLNGVASYANQQGNSAHYEAEKYMEERALPNGDKYQVEAYKNVRRP